MKQKGDVKCPKCGSPVASVRIGSRASYDFLERKFGKGFEVCSKCNNVWNPSRVEHGCIIVISIIVLTFVLTFVITWYLMVNGVGR
jgi:uncharacterized protein (UPF0212 family)